mgnify:CR=1 FL=1
MTRDGYECYKLYLALQRHFSTTYDFFTYNGKVNASVESYSKRPDVFKFEKLSKILTADQRLDFFVSHFITLAEYVCKTQWYNTISMYIRYM